MILEHYNMNKCHLCHSGAIQSKIILKTLLKELSFLTQNQRIFISQTTDYQNNQGFLYLIRMIDFEGSIIKSTLTSCKHSKMINLFKKKMNCNSNTLNYICSITASKISERCYHLWLLESQVRNIAQRNNFKTLEQNLKPNDIGKNTNKNELADEPFEKNIKQQNLKLLTSQKQSKQAQIIAQASTQAALQDSSKKTSSEALDQTFQSA